MSAKQFAHFAEHEQVHAIYSTKIDIILYIKERIMQKVKALKLFVKATYLKFILSLHHET